jgi:acyl-CoA hydrolase/GNAT superfamily N-acetyltransferase
MYDMQKVSNDNNTTITGSSIRNWRTKYPEKFASEEQIFRRIRRGDHIFVASGCGEPQYLIQSLIRFIESHPKAFFDTEIIHVYSMGLSPYADEKFRSNFRHNSFFIGNSTRIAINKGTADYTPISLSQVPALMNCGIVKIDVAVVQTSLPDEHGYLSLGVSVDIVKAATENASLVIAQINSHMPRVHGDGFLHLKDVDFAIPHDEPILEKNDSPPGEEVEKIGKNVAQLIQDGDTIQVGYGVLPNAIMANLYEKRHLGIHTELLGDGLVRLIKAGVIDNNQKTINRGISIAAFSMGTRDTYEFLNDNPAVVFKTIDYTNNPLIIAQHENMVAINSALEIDLTGQATAESLGGQFFSGVGGQQDFMRGALLGKYGKSILAIKSTAMNGTVSRISPALKESSGVTINRADVRYVVTEYGIAYLHGKNIRERAMDLISIAHPTFRANLIEEAKKRGLIYADQAYIPEIGISEYREDLETYRTTKTGLQIFLRPVKINDEPSLKDFFYSLSENSLYRRFFSTRQDMPHEKLQKYVIIDHTKALAIVVTPSDNTGVILAYGQYEIDEAVHFAEVAFVVRDGHQNKGIGTELLSYLTYIAKREGLLGFTATVLMENKPMMHIFEQGELDLMKKIESGVYELEMPFRQ